MTAPAATSESDPKPPCANCIRARGLCHACKERDRSILPQLAVNVGWLKMIGDALCEQRNRQHAEPDPEAERVKARKERKRAKKESASTRLVRGMAGEHLRARAAVAA